MQPSSSQRSYDADIPELTSVRLRSQRSVLLLWLRKMHGWIGLWGAVLGLLFGVTGIVQNHRSIMKISVAHAEENMVQLPLPNPAPTDAQAMAAWLRTELAIGRDASRIKSEGARPVPWGDKTLKQPARWTVAFSTPQNNVQAEYWVGNNFVSIKRNDNNMFATLNNLHKGTGVGAAWILLADTLAGSIILLSLSGVLLWALTNRRRMVGAAIGLTSIAAAFGLAALTM